MSDIPKGMKFPSYWDCLTPSQKLIHIENEKKRAADETSAKVAAMLSGQGAAAEQEITGFSFATGLQRGNAPSAPAAAPSSEQEPIMGFSFATMKPVKVAGGSAPSAPTPGGNAPGVDTGSSDQGGDYPTSHSLAQGWDNELKKME